MSQQPIIEVKDLSKIYNGLKVLDIPELTIRKGESFGLVGNNGAGKTTFFRLALDLIRADSGYVTSKGKRIDGADEWKPYTGSFLDHGFLIDFLTPEEYFNFLASVYGMIKSQKDEFLASFEDLFAGEVLGKNKYIRELSSGNQQKVGIVSSLFGSPEIVILDEPFNSIDPSTQIRLIRLLNKLSQEQGVTLMISSHDLNHITEVCKRIVLLEDGKIIDDKITSPNTLAELMKYFEA